MLIPPDISLSGQDLAYSSSSLPSDQLELLLIGCPPVTLPD